MDQVALQQVQWLWGRYIPFGKLTMIQGDPGEGKTTLALRLAAACSTGELLPGMEPMDPFNVIYQSAEDGLGDTIKPRLMDAGADQSRIWYVKEDKKVLTLADNRIEEAIYDAKARLMILDPVQGILDNDFYIGTFRQRKYTRKKINGVDVKLDEDDHIVIENHHQPIIDYRTFATTRALREKRTTSHYRGVKKNDNVYSGFMECGDCGSPMFATSRSDMKPAYTCGTYHRRGLAGCTSHHIRVDRLDYLLKLYVQKVMENSAAMLEQLNSDLAKEQEDVTETENCADRLAEILVDLQAELKATKRQRIRDIMKHPEQEAILEETYDEMEAELQKKIEGIRNQIEMLSDKRNTILRVNRAAKTAMDVFRDILQKEKLERNDLELIISKIKVYEDHLEILLKADVDALIRCGTVEMAANFDQGIKDNLSVTLVQSAAKQKDKVFDVNVISDGEGLPVLYVQQKAPRSGCFYVYFHWKFTSPST